MARKSQDLRRIEARASEVAGELAAHQTRVAELRAELDELDVARRVLSRLAGGDEQPEVSLQIDVDPSEGSAGDELADGQNLTIGNMALVLLDQAGPEGLTSNEILERIKQRWMPDLMRTSLSPPLSRLKKRRQIDQVDDRWRIIPGNEHDPRAL